MWTRRRPTKWKIDATHPGALLSLGALAIGLAMAAGVSSASGGDVKVGDIIAFQPDPSVWQPPRHGIERIAVHRVGDFGCVLDLGVLRRLGGSLVAEARIAAEGYSFRLHWAGARTAAGAADCGPSADLIMDRTDLRRLARAARADDGAAAAHAISALPARL